MLHLFIFSNVVLLDCHYVQCFLPDSLIYYPDSLYKVNIGVSLLDNEDQRLCFAPVSISLIPPK